jgi:hypothetical protein
MLHPRRTSSSWDAGPGAVEAGRRIPSIFQSKDDPEIDFRFQYKMILKT